jgi:Tol biopolymer transport system component
MVKNERLLIIKISIFLIIILLFLGCINNGLVPHVNRWGIYSLNLSTKRVDLIYSSNNEITTLRLNNNGNSFVFSMMIDGSEYNNTEICLLNIDGANFNRLTENNFWDLYPTWSPDDNRIAFLSFREDNLDIYMMNADGSNQSLFYDSGSHDADIHWIDDIIVFTSASKIWRIKDDGTEPFTITNPPNTGEWGNANLPFGDYDPNIHPDKTKIAFERLEEDTSPHGNYNIFTIEIDGSNETRLTNNYFTQGFPTWSNSGDKILFLVSAIQDEGKYDLYIMDSDGSNITNITPNYFPDRFLCHAGIFSNDDTIIYFIGEWWE